MHTITTNFVVPQGAAPLPVSLSRSFLWLLALPAGAFILLITAFVAFFFVTAQQVKKSPGYTLATDTVCEHPGVVAELGPRVTVADTKAWHYTTAPSGNSLNLTLKLRGSAKSGIAEVQARELGGRWVVERATLSVDRGRFGLLADGGLQPVYDPKHALASSAP